MTLHLGRRAFATVSAATATAALLSVAFLSSADAASTTRSASASIPHPIRCAAPGHKAVTVVFVHGAWADSSSWNGEVRRLQQAGCPVRAADNPVEDLNTDSQKVAALVRTIDGPVLLVGHSYGGSVITNVGAQAPNVVGLVYVDAFAPAVGEPASKLGGATSAIATTPPAQVFQQIPGAPSGSSWMILRKKFFREHFASDLSTAQADQLWATQTIASSGALDTPSKYAAWKTLPAWYFLSTGDQIITPQAQRAQATRANAHITVFRGGSHLTLISHPDAVTGVIAKALSGVTASPTS